MCPVPFKGTVCVNSSFARFSKIITEGKGFDIKEGPNI